MKLKFISALIIALSASPAFALNEGTIECSVKGDHHYRRARVDFGELASDCMDFETGIFDSAIKLYTDSGSDFEVELPEVACIRAVQPERGDFLNLRKVEGSMASDKNVRVMLMLNPKRDQKLVILNTKTAQADILHIDCQKKEFDESDRQDY